MKTKTQMALTELSISQLVDSDRLSDQVITPISSSDPQAVASSYPQGVVVPQTDLNQSSKWSFWSVFGSTFVTIFLAELGDKTQIATLLMSAESHAPWVVFAGSATALIATSLIGVLIGRWLCTRLSPKTLEKATGTLLLFISLLLLLDVIRS